MPATLAQDVISTAYKKILFQKDDDKLYYTNLAGTDDVEMTTLASPMTLSGLITASAGIKLGNNIIYNSDDTAVITLNTSDVAITGDLTVTGNDIKSSSATAITMTGANVAIAGDLTITGGNITNAITCDSSLTTTGLLTANANIVIGNDLGGVDRSIVFGHNTAKSIMGIDSDQGIFAINTDAAFEADNDFEINTDGDVTIKGDLTISGNNITNALTLGSTLDVSGDTSISGNLTFTGGGRDIIFTQADGLEIKDLNSSYISMINDTIRMIHPSTFTGKATFSGNNGPEAGDGITDPSDSVYKSYVRRFGDMIKTTIYIDIAGLSSSGVIGDIIGENATSENCHIGQITSDLNGTIVAGRITAFEDVAGGATDIDLYTATDGTGQEDDAISSLAGYKEVVNAGVIGAGSSAIFANNKLPAANEYLYLVAQAATSGSYVSGKFLIEMWGTV